MYRKLLRNIAETDIDGLFYSKTFILGKLLTGKYSRINLVMLRDFPDGPDQIYTKQNDLNMPNKITARFLSSCSNIKKYNLDKPDGLLFEVNINNRPFVICLNRDDYGFIWAAEIDYE